MSAVRRHGARTLLGQRCARLCVLAYARIDDAAAFERQMEHLAGHQAVVSVARVLDTFEGGHALPPGAVLLAFGDEHSFHRVAWPILARRSFAAVLFVGPSGGDPRTGLAPAERRALAERGVVLGCALAVPATFAELRRRFHELEQEAPVPTRVLRHAPGAPDERGIELARRAGVELAVTTLRGANDLAAVDPLFFRSLAIDGNGPVAELQVALEGSPGGDSARATDPWSEPERRAARAARAARRRVRFLHRPLDAFLTAGLRPRARVLESAGVLLRHRGSHYERLRSLVHVLTFPCCGLERPLRRALLDPARLALRERAVELVGHGTAATVFGLGPRSAPGAQVLKVYRWTLGLPPGRLFQIARRHRTRHQQLRRWFGEHVLPTRYLVGPAPLRGLPALLALQERLEQATDLLARPDAELLALFRSRPALGVAYAAFARRVLAVRELGFFPDLLGSGNLLLDERAGGARLCLIDSGLFDLRTGTGHLPAAAIQERLARLERLLR